MKEKSLFVKEKRNIVAVEFLVLLLLLIGSGISIISSNAYQYCKNQNNSINDHLFPTVLTSEGIPFPIYSSYFGGSLQDFIVCIEEDNFGNYYVSGITDSGDLPILNAYQSTISSGGMVDVFLAKFNADNELLYSTYFGGTSQEEVFDIIVDNESNCYICGYTYSPDFPTKNALNSTSNGSFDGFIAKFNATGQLEFSTYFGGSNDETCFGITLDESNNIYITGSTSSDDLPVLNAWDDSWNSASDAFLAKLTTDGDLLYCSYYGGSDSDEAREIAIDGDGNCVIAGDTLSSDLPVPDGYDTSYNGSLDIFIAKFNSTGYLIYGSFFGGTDDDICHDICVDMQANYYFTGSTHSSDFDTKNAFDTSFDGLIEAYVVKFNSTNDLSYSSYLGGDNDDVGYGIACDNIGKCFISGYTISSDFPLVNAYMTTYHVDHEAFLTILDSTGAIEYSTYFGGDSQDQALSIYLDGKGKCYFAGYSASDDFPLIGNIFQDTRSGEADGFIATFIVNDILAPTIKNIAFTPAIPTYTDEVIVSATIKDNYHLENASIFLRRDNSSWEDLGLMTLATGDNYTKSIGTFETTIFVEFVIKAYDTWGNYYQSHIRSFVVGSAGNQGGIAFYVQVIIGLVVGTSIYLNKKRKY
ncbi:MAG: SBBP repeat-containing protein [Candidatus Thorarchaeota archaeon]